MQKRIAVIFISVLIVLVSLVILQHILSAVPENDPYAIGNTSGNLQNGGMFCEDGGIIYFSNVNDNRYLYSMNTDGSDLKCLLKAPVSYINSAGDYLYFYQEANKENGAFGSLVRTMGVYRLKKNSRQSPDCLDRTPAKIVALCGSDLYYEHYETKEGIRLYAVSIKGGDRHEVSESDINPACVIDGNIFYPNLDANFYLSCFHPNTGHSDIVIADMKVYNLVYDNGYIYYMNVGDDYKLYRYKVNEDHVTKLTDCRVDTFNVLNNVIFYQKNGADDAALMRMNADGSGNEVIAPGNHTCISMTNDYTYYCDYNEEDHFYRVPTNGSANVSRFDETVSD
ncbi:MAG: DUF5050 domain-containing protein [Lachnospiraceae bacterium]|nr:DUF5050 domain-containing protein [Lachnospiraceae bacterium]